MQNRRATAAAAAAAARADRDVMPDHGEPRYHKIGRKGKLEIAPTKLVGTAEDLSVAYSPGVAEPCLSIVKNEKWAYEYTAKGHLGDSPSRISSAVLPELIQMSRVEAALLSDWQ